MPSLHLPSAKYLARKVIALVMFVALASCSSTPPVMPTGEWTGSVAVGNGTGYPIEIAFVACARGEVCATVKYSSLDCESELKFVRMKDNLPVFEETVTYGNFCKSGRTVQMSFVDENTPMELRWFEKDGEAGPIASLNSGQVVEPTLAPLSIPGFGHEVYSIQNMGLFINWRAAQAEDGSLWVPDSHSGNLLRIDTNTRQIVATIKVGDPESSLADGYDPNSVAVSGDRVWVTQRAEQAIGRIDPATNTLVESLPLPNIPYDLVFDGNILWVGSFEGDVVMKVNLDSKEVTSTYVNKPVGITVGGGSVWAVEHRNGNLVRIDAQTTDFVARVDLSLPAPAPQAQPEEVIFAEGSAWVANNGGRTVSRVDAVTNELLATIQFEGRVKPLRLASGGGYIWVSLAEELGSNAGDWIAQIDPATNTVVKQTPFDYAGFLIYDDGVLWVGDAYGNINKRAGDRIFKIELEK